MRRIAELDGARGLAAVAIVSHHMFMDRVPFGWAAVDVFFVLSGYLITTIVLEHGSSPGFLPAFYARRGLRIWPIYFLLLLVLAIAWRDDPAAIPYYLTYTQQVPHYWGGHVPQWYGMQHTWTLALEEQFYLIWPALVLLVGRRWTVPLALALALGSIVARGVGVDHWVLAGRCDGFALGGLLAALLAGPDAERARRRALRWAAGGGVLALLLVVGQVSGWPLIGVRGPDAYRVHVTVASLASFAVIAVLVRSSGHAFLSVLRLSPLVFLGTISYGLYLFHIPVLKLSAKLATDWGFAPGPPLWALQVLLVVAAATVSWHVIERPILRLKDLVPYRPLKPTVQDTCAPGHEPVGALARSVS